MQAEGPGRGGGACARQRSQQEKLRSPPSRSSFLPSVLRSPPACVDIRPCDKGAEGACWLVLGSVLEADTGGALNPTQAAAQFTVSTGTTGAHHRTCDLPLCFIPQTSENRRTCASSLASFCVSLHTWFSRWVHMPPPPTNPPGCTRTAS